METTNAGKKWREIGGLLLLLILLQLLYAGLKHIGGAFGLTELGGSKLTACCAMLLLTPIFLLFTRRMGTSLQLWPARFGKGYIIFTLLTATLLISAPDNYRGGWPALLALFYGSIVTPIFEELIFRGYLWKRLEQTFPKLPAVFWLNVALFTLWHLGYMTQPLLAGNWTAVLLKLAAACGYGLLLSVVRSMTGNCYAPILLHAALNTVMI